MWIRTAGRIEWIKHDETSQGLLTPHVCKKPFLCSCEVEELAEKTSDKIMEIVKQQLSHGKIMYQPKVNKTQKHSDRQGEHIVCESKLLLIETDWQFLTEQSRKYLGNVKAPIIISETEEIEVGDWYYYQHFGEHIISSVDEALKGGTNTLENLNSKDRYYKKILALPEHFSDKHLKVIVDGKMKDEDKLYLKVYTRELAQWDEDVIYKDKQNHITLFPAKKDLEEAVKVYSAPFNEGYKSIEDAFKAGAEWAKKNNY